MPALAPQPALPQPCELLDKLSDIVVYERMHVVVEMPQFRSDVKSAGLSDQQRVAIIDRLAAEPMAGDLIRGSGGARKVRFAGRGKGKSGGYRVITL